MRGTAQLEQDPMACAGMALLADNCRSMLLAAAAVAAVAAAAAAVAAPCSCVACTAVCRDPARDISGDSVPLLSAAAAARTAPGEPAVLQRADWGPPWKGPSHRR